MAGARGEGGTAPRRIERLRDEIRRHDYLYFVLDRPILSDRDYDRLVEKLRSLEAGHPELRSVESPTERVGGQIAPGFETRAHARPLLSLQATREEGDVAGFVTRVLAAAGKGTRFLLQPKLDGLSMELVYERGTLRWAVTRGDGRRGEVVTGNVRTIGSVPLRLRGGSVGVPRSLSVRGEVLMPLEGFERVNRRLIEAGDEPFANPRNAAAGSVRQLDSSITASRPLRFVAYEILAVSGRPFGSDQEALAQLRAWGLVTPDLCRVAGTRGEIERYHQRLEQRRDSLRYEIDGVVIKIDDLGARQRLGVTSHHPRWALAWKFEPRVEVTTLEGIVIQVGRTGLLTPVALLKPVDVSGVTVSRATLHNALELARRDLRPGDTVRIHRAGDVIPEVVERVARGGRRSAPFRMPSRCPVCRTRVVGEGPLTWCPNRLGCRAQLIGRLVHFASGDAFDLEGLGPRTIDAMVKQGLVKRAADLFRLTPDALRGLEGIGPRLGKKLVRMIQSRRRAELARFLVALGIPGVGGATARDLARHFGRFDRVRTASPSILRKVPGIGEGTARSIHGFFRDASNTRAIDALLAGVTVLAATTPAKGALAGKRVVFTGELDAMTRREAGDLVRSAGGDTGDSVGRGTDFVVAGRAPGTKLERARVLGISVLSEAAFLKLVKRGRKA